MNSSVTPSILPRSSLSESSSSPASSSSKCAKCTACLFRSGWLPLSFLRGKKLVVLGLGGPSAVWVLEPWGNSIESSSQPPRWPLGSLNMFSPADPPLGSLPSLSITWEVCHRSILSLTLPHDLGEHSQGRKQLKPGDALKGQMPQSTLFPYLPSIIGIAPGSAHQALSCCYSVHPRLSTHCPRLYPYQSSVLTLQDSLARILLHRIGGCNPCTLHVNILLNPTSNCDRLLCLWHPCP